ncbi:MAG: PilN domain-containing protein [Thiobacillus sp.]|nr:PilN domain-containing protein [Thiobacillus sp.]
MSQQINLISPLLLKKRYAFGLREMALGLGGVLAVALAWTAYLHVQAGSLETRAAEQEALQATAQQELDQLTAAADRPVSALLIGRIETARAQVVQREALLASIGGTLKSTSTGFAPRLRALSHSHTNGVWLNGFTLSPGYVELQGSSLNAGLLTTYLDQLGKQAAFSGMQFSGMTAGASTAEVAGLPAHIDFTLISGNADTQGKSDGQ